MTSATFLLPLQLQYFEDGRGTLLHNINVSYKNVVFELLCHYGVI